MKLEKVILSFWIQLLRRRVFLCFCLSNWNMQQSFFQTEGIFIRCRTVLNKCGLWCSLISACSTCSVWAPFAGSVPRRLLKEPLHLCQGQVEIRCILLIGQSAFQTLRHHTCMRLSYKPGVNRGFCLAKSFFFGSGFLIFFASLYISLPASWAKDIMRVR